MTKKEFMMELEIELSKIPDNEKSDALAFYEDYFAEANILEDMVVPESMGTPNDIAKQIIDDIGQKESQSYMDENANIKNEKNMYVPYYKERYSKDEESGNFSDQSYQQSANKNQNNGNKNKSDSRLITVLILLVVFSPIWFSLLVSVGATIFALLVSLACIVFSLIIAGFVVMISSFMASGFFGGMVLAGIGVLLVAIGLLFVIPLVAFCGKFLPWVIKETVKFFKWALGLTRKEQA